jgi:hypothetical protein
MIFQNHKFKMENQVSHADKMMGGNTNFWINWNKGQHDNIAVC